METKIICFCNHKGGVAKTTSVASVGSALAKLGRSVLLVDLDAQSNLTSSLLGYEPERSTYDALREREALPIIPVGETGVDVAPASLDLAGIELEIASAIEREKILKDVLKDVDKHYDYILLDCPPSLGLLTLNALVASTDVIIPLTAEALPSKGLQKIADIINMTKRRLNEELRTSGILILATSGASSAKQLRKHYEPGTEIWYSRRKYGKTSRWRKLRWLSRVYWTMLQRATERRTTRSWLLNWKGGYDSYGHETHYGEGVQGNDGTRSSGELAGRSTLLRSSLSESSRAPRTTLRHYGAPARQALRNW